ncbi:MAG: amidohydrolase family protein [Spirochaetales bacterium]|nr:amidohydrolase family protein [Spirochaetales bacterium]
MLRNANVLLGSGEFRECDVRIDGPVISAIGEGLGGGEERDVGGCYVLPGLIDLHTHGIGYQAVEVCDLSAYAEMEAARGATSVVPTMFAPLDEILRQLKRHRAETAELSRLKQVRGFRLESPYVANTGAGRRQDLEPISRETTDAILEAGGGHIRIWDISPELPRAPEEIRYLTGKGIVCSIAHTKATIEQSRAAVDAGAALVTHLFDVFELPEQTESGVIPAGLVDYLLTEDRVVCEIIPDGTHVSPILVEEAWRCKSPERIAMVTDSNLGAGLPPGRYTLARGLGEVIIRDVNDGVRLVDRGMGLAGSALTPLDGLRNLVRLFGKSLELASRVCSRTPARLLGLNAGEIAEGRDADLIVLDEQLHLLLTITRGAVVFRAESLKSTQTEVLACLPEQGKST